MITELSDIFLTVGKSFSDVNLNLNFLFFANSLIKLILFSNVKYLGYLVLSTISV